MKGERREWSPRALSTRLRVAFDDRYFRRRSAAGLVLVALAVGIVLVVTGGASGSRGRRASRSSANGIAGIPVPDPDRRARATELTAAAAVDSVLSYTPYIRAGTSRGREVALTFDDGPGPYTARILRVLQRTRTPATFFVIGEWAHLYPGLVRAEAHEGSEVGDHTETHPFMSSLPAAAQRTEILDAAAAISSTGAPSPVLWRPPYGSFNQTTLGILRKLRMLIVLWTIDTSDYARPGVGRIVYGALSGAKSGAIILMHDGGGDRSETVAALPRIILALRRRRYRLVTVSQLLTDDPPPRDQPAPQPLSGVG
jgi:peptidoglycan/xylan/chitin deacetylase (PgdA/CDA1 family)